MEGVTALPAGVHGLGAMPPATVFTAVPTPEQLPEGVPGPPPRRSASSSLIRLGRISPVIGPPPSSGASWRRQAAASVRSSANPFCRFSSWAQQPEKYTLSTALKRSNRVGAALTAAALPVALRALHPPCSESDATRAHRCARGPRVSF